MKRAKGGGEIHRLPARRQICADGLKRINPLAQDLDFLAAILGGGEHLGHHVIYLDVAHQAHLNVASREARHVIIHF